MADNAKAVEEVQHLLDEQLSLHDGWHLSTFKPTSDWVSKRIKYEIESGIGDEKEQREWFVFMHDVRTKSLKRELHSTGYLMFIFWAQKTENLYARIYQIGFSDGMVEAFKQAKKATDREKKKRARLATKGRRAIGTKSRIKVKIEAEHYRHLSKERAAAEIADIVNLDTGTIRRYLSELFPGNMWKK